MIPPYFYYRIFSDFSPAFLSLYEGEYIQKVESAEAGIGILLIELSGG